MIFRALLFTILLLPSLAIAKGDSTAEYNRTVNLVISYTKEVDACAEALSCAHVCITKLLAHEFRSLAIIRNYGATYLYVDMLSEASNTNGGIHICQGGDLQQDVDHENQRTLGRVP